MSEILFARLDEIVTNTSLATALALKANLAGGNTFTGTQLISGAALNITLAPYVPANPANAAIFWTIPNVANGYTTPFDGFKVQVGATYPASSMFGAGTLGVQQAIVGTLSIDAGDTAGNAGFGMIGYGVTNSAITGVVGVGGTAKCNAPNSSCWGANYVVSNSHTPLVANTGVNANWMSAVEYDMGTWKTAGGIDPVFGNIYGVYLYGSGNNTTDMGTGFAIEGLSVTTGAKWINGFWSKAGGAVNAFVVGATAKTGASLNSQKMLFQSVNSGSTTINSTIFANSLGDLIVQPNSGKISIGPNQTAPDAPLTINMNTGATVSPTTSINATMHLVGVDAQTAGIVIDSFGGTPAIAGRRTDGTFAARTGVVDTDQLLTLIGQGWDTVAMATGSNVQLRATQTWSAVAHGAEAAFRTVPNGSTTPADGLVVRNSGGVTIGAANTIDPGINNLSAAGSIKSNGATSGIGYATGAGGSVVQATSKATGVTLNTVSGQITTNAASLAAGTNVAFTLTDSAIGANDTVSVNMKSGGTAASYIIWTDSVAAGSAVIGIRNTNAGALAEAIVLTFNVIKGVIT